MIPVASVMLPISHPEHPLYHGDCACCCEHYGKAIPETVIASDKEARQAIQGAKGLYALPRLREIRKADYTTKSRLAKLSGVSARQIFALENGENMARENTALRLAGALYVTVADLEGTS